MTQPGEELLFLALGGSDEIGMNANLYGCRGKWVMVDLGVTFADHQYPGIDIVLPDIGFAEDLGADLLGIVLTHGHEDHIGALPYLAADLGVPLYAMPFTASLIASKLEENGDGQKVAIRTLDPGVPLTLGPFTFHPMAMAHSIPDMHAFVIETPLGRVFHTGDWKFDENPVLGQPVSDNALRALGDAGVRALVCDSTNAFNEENSGSEGSVRQGLLDSVAQAKARVLVTTFASNAARLQTLADVARATGRQLCLAGRSLDRITRAAQANRVFRDFPDPIDPDSAMRLPPSQVLIVATGGQGEPNAALARIAAGNHTITLDQDDLVIFSSKQIPGNEVAIGAIQNALARRNIRAITEKQAHVHVSGHPGRPELVRLYQLLRPEMLIPVHGERRHMAEQARLAQASGVPRTLVQSNGDIVRLAPDGPAIIDHVHTGRLVLDGDVILPADGSTINERRKLALNGQISVAVAIDGGNRIQGTPEIRFSGIPIEEDKAAFMEEAVDAARTAVADGARDEAALREALRLAVRRCATRWTGKKPIVDVLLIRV